jgi:hypothetical protein
MAREVGSPLGLGIVGGLESEQRRMDDALRSFVSVPATAGKLQSTLAPNVAPGNNNIRVFIGDRELTDIVRVEVDNSQTTQARQLLNGRRV